MTQRDHLPPQAQAFFARDKAWCLARAADVGPRCAELVECLLADRVSERLRAAQGVLALGSRYGAQRLEVACERALTHDSAHYCLELDGRSYRDPKVPPASKKGGSKGPENAAK